MASNASALKKLKIIKGKIIVNQNNLEFKNRKFKYLERRNWWKEK